MMAAKMGLRSLLLLLLIVSHIALLAHGLPTLSNRGSRRLNSITRPTETPAHSIELVFSLEKSLEAVNDSVYHDARYKGLMVGTATAATYAVSRALQRLYPGDGLHVSVPRVEPMDEDIDTWQDETQDERRAPARSTRTFVAHLKVNGVDSHTHASELMDLVNTASTTKTHPHWHELSRAISEVTSHFGLKHLSAGHGPSFNADFRNGTAHRRLITQKSYKHLQSQFKYLMSAWRYTSNVYTTYQKWGTAKPELGTLGKLSRALVGMKAPQQIKAAETAVASGTAIASAAAQNAAMATPMLLSGSFINTAGAALSITTTLIGFFVKSPADVTQLKLDFIMKVVNQINATVTETLERVKILQDDIYDIEDRLLNVEKLLGIVMAEIQQTECYVSNMLVDQVWVNRLKPLWYQFAIGESSIINSMTYIVDQFSKGYLSEYAKERFDEAIEWAKNVQRSAYADLDSIHHFLVDGFLPGTLTMCNIAFQARWANRVETDRTFPFDDRQYYETITNFLAQKTTYQANGIMLIDQAFELLAMNAVMLKGRELNQTVSGYFRSGFCDFVMGNSQNESNALFAGYTICKDKDTYFRKIYDNVVQQIETVGQPFSFGEPGEGLRLLMGTDFVTYPGRKMDYDYKPESWEGREYKVLRGNTRQEATASPVRKETRYLIPASLSGFDPRCSSPDVKEAEAAGCSLMGYFDSCTHGCDKDPIQEARWRDLSSPFGIHLDAWDIANGSVWLDIEDAFAGWAYNNSEVDQTQSYKLDVFRLMEADFSDSIHANFKEMSDRPFWIVNQTADKVLWEDLFIDKYPLHSDFPETSLSGRPCLHSNIEPEDRDRPFDFYQLNSHYPNAKCFAVSIPESEATHSDWFVRPSGIHCSSTGFRELFQQRCIDNSTATPCIYRIEGSQHKTYCGGLFDDQRKKRCFVKLKDFILQHYSDILGPANNKSGVAYTGCGWSWYFKEEGSCPKPEHGNRWFAGCGTVDWNFFDGAYHFVERVSKENPFLLGVGQQDLGEYYYYGDDRYGSFGNVRFNFKGAPSEFVYPFFPQPPLGTPTKDFTEISWYFGDNFERLLDEYETEYYSFTPSDASQQFKMFRLPYVDVNKLTCTPSPFVNAGHQDDPTAPRPRRSPADIIIPCDDWMTQAVVNFVGAGYYTGMSYGSNATLEIGDDRDTITCNEHWATNIYTTHKFIKVWDGPIFADESLGGTGNISDPFWVSREVDFYDGVNTTAAQPQIPARLNVSLSELFPANLSTFNTRVISCTVTGVDQATLLPITITSVSKLLTVPETPTDGRRRKLAEQASSAAWQDFFYPLHTGPCYDPGCIATITSGMDGPSWIAQGPAVNWAGYETWNNTLFVLHNGGLGQIAPSMGDVAKIPDTVNDAVQASVTAAISSVIGFDVDDRGALLFTGNYSATSTGGGSTIFAPWSNSTGDYSNANARVLGSGNIQCFNGSSIVASNIFFKSVGGSWRHPLTGDLYIVDAGCGMLYRIDQAALDPACAGAFGSCGGQVHFLADLVETADMALDTNEEDGGQRVPLAGDVGRDILYAAFAGQGGIVALNLTDGSRQGWMVASRLLLDNGSYVEAPICGFMGDGGPATGDQAALSCEVRQMIVDTSTGDLYIADSGNHRIRMVNYASKTINTVAGTGFSAYTGDCGQAIDASLSRPSGLALAQVPDSKFVGGIRKMLYISDTGNGVIRRVLLSERSTSNAPAVTCEQNVDHCAQYNATCFGGGSSQTCLACSPGFHLNTTNTCTDCTPTVANCASHNSTQCFGATTQGTCLACNPGVYLNTANNTCSAANPLPTGTNITQNFTNENGDIVAILTFSNVTVAGFTTITVIDNATGLAPFPAGFQISGMAYDIETTAVNSNGVEVCLLLPSGMGPEDDGSMPVVLHFQDSAWVDITTSYNAETGKLCGHTTHFSPFFVGFDTSSDMKMGKLVLKKGFKLSKSLNNDHWKIQTDMNSADVSNMLENALLGGSGITVTIFDSTGAEIDRVAFSSSSCEMKSRRISCKGKNAKVSWAPKAKPSGVYTMQAGFKNRALPALELIQAPLTVSVDFSAGILESTTTSCSLSKTKQGMRCD